MLLEQSVNRNIHGTDGEQGGNIKGTILDLSFHLCSKPTLSRSTPKLCANQSFYLWCGNARSWKAITAPKSGDMTAAGLQLAVAVYEYFRSSAEGSFLIGGFLS